MIMMGGAAASNLDGEETEFEDIAKVKQKAIQALGELAGDNVE